MGAPTQPLTSTVRHVLEGDIDDKQTYLTPGGPAVPVDYDAMGMVECRFGDGLTRWYPRPALVRIPDD